MNNYCKYFEELTQRTDNDGFGDNDSFNYNNSMDDEDNQVRLEDDDEVEEDKQKGLNPFSENYHKKLISDYLPKILNYLSSLKCKTIKLINKINLY